MAQISNEERGSHKILEQLFGKSANPSTEDVKSALAVERVNYKILWWWWKGTPNPTDIYAKLIVDRSRAGELVQQLINNKSLELSVEVSAIGARTNELVVDVSNIPKEVR